MPWGAAIGAGAAIYGANQQAGAASDAAKAGQEGQLQAMLAQQKATEQANKWLKPYRFGGEEALSQLNYLMGLGDPSQMARTPSNFDESMYRQYLIDRKRDELSKLYPNNQGKVERQLAKQTERIDSRLKKVGGWTDYQRKMSEGNISQSIDDFFRKRDTSGQQMDGMPDRGFLLQRFNNTLFEKDPGYQFRMDEGAKAVQGSAAAQGGLLSGAAMKSMQKYGQGFASNEYGNAYNRFANDQSNIYGRLTGMTDMGMRAAGAQGQNVMHQGQQAAQSFTNMADYKAAGIMGAGNARQSGYGQVGNTLLDVWAKNQTNKQTTKSSTTESSTKVSWNPVTQTYE